MKIRNPKSLRAQMARQKQWLTVPEMASGVGLHRNTMYKALRQQPITVSTARRIAEALEKDVLEIAEFVS